ncbi:hypothetical protein KC19_2G176300 [Ceratodon purpureus]|uniref:Uncharacterized protein n=1 Tax=Ceratodon purpureus TaxID=3225 RepID=A0A8T0IWK3_CERPU|nr:hypothetical protein KC19_2G176300 [Ceratodon purpureus]
MEDVDVQKLSRKELLQLCADHNIRTAGIKHDDLVRLLQNKLHPPASDPPRVTPKARSTQINSNSPVSSPKARNQTSNRTSADSPFSSPNAKGKSAERPSLPSPATTTQGRSLRPLVLEDDRSRNNSPEPSPRTPRKDQLSPSPGALPRKPTTTKSTAPPAQRSDLLRKKVNTMTTIGKLQAQERARPPQQGDGSPVKGRNNVASAPIGKQAQATRPQQIDRGSPVKPRGSAAIGAPKKNIKSTSVPVKRPGERTSGVKSNEALRKGQSTNPSAAHSEGAASSPRASEGEASVAATAGTHSDLGSHSFRSVSEIATDAGHHGMWEDSDADDAQSVSSEPASRFAPQGERFHSPRTSTGSKLGRVGYSSWESAHGRRSSLDSSLESNAPLGKDSDLSATPGEETSLISSYSLEDDAAFNLVGDAHGLEINSFLDAHSGTHEEDVTAAASTQKHESSDSGNARVEHDAPASETLQEEPRESIPALESNAPVVEQEDAPTQPSGIREQKNDIPAASSRNVTDVIEAAEGQLILTSEEKVKGHEWLDTTLNAVQEKDSSADGVNPVEKNTPLATSSLSHEGLSNYNSGVTLAEETDPLCYSGKDFTVTSTDECIERVHFNLDSAPLPHPDMERSPMSVSRPETSLTTGGDLDLCAGKSSIPCDELQQEFDIKLRGGHGAGKFGQKHDYSKERSTKSILLQSDRSEKVPLLQDGHENEISMQLIRKPFPSSIFLWCSQLFYAIFGTRSQH